MHSGCTIRKRLSKKEMVVDTQVNLVAWTQHGTYAAFAAGDTKGNGFKERFLAIMANKVRCLLQRRIHMRWIALVPRYLSSRSCPHSP